MNIVDIKATMENLETGVFDRTTGTKELFLPMFEHLLSIIEQAEKALSDTKDELAKVVNKMCGGTVKRYIFEETREVYYSVDKALQAIRKGD